jgi:hypothetical protein
MRIFVLDIIVIEICSIGGCSLEEASEHFSLSNQSALSGVILVSFWYYCGVVLVIFLFICHFYLIIFVLHTILYLEYYKWYQSTFLGRKLWVKFFFRVETYFDIFNL